jgi:FkbM family methyltransferase
MKFLYGTTNKAIDVTEICHSKLKKNGIIRIPCGDISRSQFFGDPLFGTLKSFIIESDDGEIDIYDDGTVLDLMENGTVIRATNLNVIHSQLKIRHGSIKDELVEQTMSLLHLNGNEKVLELGGNIGRNSMVIASILGVNQTNLVVLESDEDIAKQLTENRDLNEMKFHIESSALSLRPLIQKGWDTKVSDVLEPGWKEVKTISLEHLRDKYRIDFDTLVIDCEGAFYYILLDMPDIINGITKILMENDYHDAEHKKYVDEVLKKNGFSVVFTRSGGWGPCRHNFWEAWVR